MLNFLKLSFGIVIRLDKQFQKYIINHFHPTIQIKFLEEPPLHTHTHTPTHKRKRRKTRGYVL